MQGAGCQGAVQRELAFKHNGQFFLRIGLYAVRRVLVLQAGRVKAVAQRISHPLCTVAVQQGLLFQHGTFVDAVVLFHLQLVWCARL